jgi:hypothetical protein
LDFQACKVRVTNVDTQQSASHIVVQVIGEISNKAAAPRKFVQTFVLAPQTNGYFVLNDIFRYLADEEDETQDDAVEIAPSSNHQQLAHVPVTELEAAPAGVLPEGIVNITKVDQELEAVKYTPDEDTNGEPTTVEDAASSDDSPTVAAAAGAESEDEKILEPISQNETPKDPAPTPIMVEPKATTKGNAVSSTPKPVVPKTWAQLAGANSAAVASATPPQPAVASSPTATQIKSGSTPLLLLLHLLLRSRLFKPLAHNDNHLLLIVTRKVPLVAGKLLVLIIVVTSLVHT